MDCDALRDDQWERIKEFVPGGTKGQARAAHRQPSVFGRALMDGAFGRPLARPAGAAWRLRTVKRRYYRWIEMGVLDGMLAALAREADLEWLMIDSTIVRAHQHAAGARKQKGGRMPRALAGLAAA